MIRREPSRSAIPVFLLSFSELSSLLSHSPHAASTPPRAAALYLVNGILMTISFFVLRVVGMGYVGLRALYISREAFFALPVHSCAMLTPIFLVGYAIQCAAPLRITARRA